MTTSDYYDIYPDKTFYSPTWIILSTHINWPEFLISPDKFFHPPSLIDRQGTPIFLYVYSWFYSESFIYQVEFFCKFEKYLVNYPISYSNSFKEISFSPTLTSNCQGIPSLILEISLYLWIASFQFFFRINPLQYGTPSRSKQGYAAFTNEIIIYLVPEVVDRPSW